jgi:hypothetical protein
VRTSSLTAVLIAVALSVGACAASDPDPSTADGSPLSADPPTGTGADSIDTAGGLQPPVDPGRSTLTIGDRTWTFDNYSCAFGHDATRSDTFSFSSVSDAYNDQGRTLYMLVEIEDETGQDRYDGEGVSYGISIVDLQHPDAPEVDYGSRDGTTVRVDSDRVTAEGTFDDFSTDGSEAIPGSFEGSCGSRSRR